MTHTPGPWSTQYYNGQRAGSKKLYVNAEYQQIAHVLHTETRGLTNQMERREANAKLIAAAPDLLEACYFAIRVLDNVKTFCSDCGQNGLWDAAQQQIQAALAKATE